MTTVEEEEIIISYLEQIDSKFSQIKNVLRQIKTKIKAIASKNKMLVENMQPWIHFFGMNDIESSSSAGRQKDASFVDATQVAYIENDPSCTEKKFIYSK